MRLIIAIFGCLVVGLVESAPTEQLCSTPMCKKSAELLQKSLNTSVNPCDNFYEFACGGWRKVPIPENKYAVGPITNMAELMMSRIKDLLMSFNVAIDGKSHAKVVTLAAKTFQQCVNATDNEKGLNHLKAAVNEVFGGWGIGQKNTGHAHKEQSWHEYLVLALTRGNIWPVIDIRMTTNSYNSSENDIGFAPADLGLGDHQLKNLSVYPSVITGYKKYIASYGKLFCGSDCSTLEKDIDEMLHLESQLANARSPPEALHDTANSDVKLTIKELSEKSSFNWHKEVIVPIYQSFGLSNFPLESANVNIYDVSYLLKAVEILKKASPRTVANLFAWRLVQGYGSAASEQLRLITFDFLKVNMGIKKLDERWKYCMGFVNGHFGFDHLAVPVSRLYVDRYFSKAERTEALKMVESIQKSFGRLLLDNEWLDEDTRFAALDKLALLTKKVAYPESFLDNAHLDANYGLNNATLAKEVQEQENHLLSMMAANNAFIKRQFQQINGLPVYNKESWIIPPNTINAVYNYHDNSITIPAGFLMFPSFSKERPFSLNYGAIGSIVGHEITHGFDDKGRQFDRNGNLNNWWSNDTATKYKQRGECLVKQYSSLVEPITGMHLNGKNGLGENTADNGGVHLSYEAFRHEQQQHPSARLADLPQYSPEQLFFLFYANGWCDMVRPEIMPTVVSDTHSPSQFRANVPLMNSKDFAAAFKCPVGSKMNPKEKCVVW